MNELKEAILNAKSICKINAIMEIAMDLDPLTRLLLNLLIRF